MIWGRVSPQNKGLFQTVPLFEKDWGSVKPVVLRLFTTSHPQPSDAQHTLPPHDLFRLRQSPRAPRRQNLRLPHEAKQGRCAIWIVWLNSFHCWESWGVQALFCASSNEQLQNVGEPASKQNIRERKKCISSIMNWRALLFFLRWLNYGFLKLYLPSDVLGPWGLNTGCLFPFPQPPRHPHPLCFSLPSWGRKPRRPTNRPDHTWEGFLRSYLR